MSPIAFAPGRPRVKDDETTTILPRSRPTKHRTQALDAIDDYADDERTALGGRAKLALILGAVAAVIVIGLVIGYAVLNVGSQPQSQPSVSAPPGGSAASGGAASGGAASGGAAQPPGQAGSALLSNDSMLTAEQAKAIASDRKWKVVTTQPGAKADGLKAACFSGDPVDGQPTPQQEIVRVLESGGPSAPKALHDATSYGSAEEASQAYAVASRIIGSCAVAGFYIEAGRSVSGIGNQALGVVVMEVTGKKAQAHSVVVNLSGRVMNVIDAVQPTRAIAIDAVGKALAQVNKVQCGSAGGACDGRLSVKKGPPPIGGDEPGFLTVGDLPPAGPKVDLWVATEVEPPKADFNGSQCEDVNWTTEKAKARTSRVYLLPESGKNFFGLNAIVLTMKDAKAADKLVSKIKSSISGCKAQRLTARVTNTTKVSSVGARKTEVSGWTAIVYQKSTQGTAEYRVGIVAAGSKVAYTFLNPRGDYDFSNHQWNTVAVRAGERATQVN